MPIEQQLEDELKQAMRSRDQRTLDVVRMIKSKIAERRTAKGFSGTVDDGGAIGGRSALRASPVHHEQRLTTLPGPAAVVVR